MSDARRRLACVVSILSGTLALAGCANDIALASSSQPDAARLRFIAHDPGEWIVLYPSDDCNRGAAVAGSIEMPRIRREVMGLKATRLEMLDPLPVDDISISEHAFAPGQVINVGGAPHCLGGVSFVAAPSTQYEVSMDPTYGSRCIFTVKRLQVAGPDVARVPERVRPLVCAALAQP